MNETESNVLKKHLKYLGLEVLTENWQKIIKDASKNRPAYSTFVKDIVEKEYWARVEKARLARLKRAKIPELCVLETFPFSQQPRLEKKIVCELHDSLSFINEKQDLIFIGPTGCGKTGLATSFLVHSVNSGYRGLFIDFSFLITWLMQSRGDHSEDKLMKKLAAFDVLLIDELGYMSCDREQASLFFDLIRRRHRRNSTIITTQLGFDEWGIFLHDIHMTAAMLDRITVNCAVFNMKDCISIRPKNVIYAVKRKESV
jgi:DNA replication protein DnaC